MGRCVLFAAALAAAMTFAGSAYAGTFPGRDGRIAFTAQAGPRTQVFTMNANGGNVRQLSNEAAGAADPDWSSGGNQLVYARSDGMATLMGSAGNLVATVSTQEPISDAAISPDGKRLVSRRAFATTARRHPRSRPTANGCSTSPPASRRRASRTAPTSTR